MPVCYCIVILTIAMIRKMVIVMINMMVITHRPLVGLEVPSKQYARYLQTHQSTIDFHECHSNTHRHPQTSLRHPQTSPGNSRSQQTETEANRHKQTLPDTLGHYQVLSEYV